VNHVML